MQDDTMTSCQIVAVISGKGGSGKTTACLSIAKLLSDVGLKVLLIDFDLATSGASYFFAPILQHRSAIGVVETLDQLRTKSEAADASHPWLANRVLHVDDGFDFLPSRSQLGGQRDEMIQDQRWNELAVELLTDLVSKAQERYDVVLIDTQAGYSFASAAACKVASKAIVVSESDRISSEAVDNLVAQLGSRLPSYRRYLINKVEIQEAGQYKALREAFRSMNRLPPLPFDFSIRRAFGEREIPVDLDSPTPFLIALFAMVKEAFPESKDLLDKYEQERVTKLFDRYQASLELLVNDRSEIRNHLRELQGKDRRQRIEMYKRTNVLLLVTMMVLGGLFMTYFFFEELIPKINFLLPGFLVVTGALLGTVYIRYRQFILLEGVDTERKELELKAKLADTDGEIDRYQNLMAVRAKEYLIDFDSAEQRTEVRSPEG